MSWRRRFHLREQIRDGLWVVPLVCGLAGLVAASVMWRLDAWGGWALLHYKPSGATALAAGVVGTMITFIGIVFSILLMAVQFASAQLTPRALNVALNDPIVKVALGLFVATFLYAMIVLARISDDFVPQLAMLGLGALAVTSLLVFLLLVSHVSQALRPAHAVSRVGRLGLAAMAETYSGPIRTPGSDGVAATATPLGRTPARIVPNQGVPGIVLAYDVTGLVAEAHRADARLELVPAVGDFVPMEAPLFRVFEPGAVVDDRRLRDSVALGPERSLEQDPAFALRILVDVAIKALSPAVNDPTSAVMALDQLHNLLRFVAGRRLDVGEHRDPGGSVRLSVGLPTWEDYVSLAIDEIRQYGASSVQVARRLKAMLDDLLEVAPEERRGALREELTLLERMVERAFTDVEDRERASVADQQGLGSSLPDGRGRA